MSDVNSGFGHEFAELYPDLALLRKCTNCEQIVKQMDAMDAGAITSSSDALAFRIACNASISGMRVMELGDTHAERIPKIVALLGAMVRQ